MGKKSEVKLAVVETNLWEVIEHYPNHSLTETLKIKGGMLVRTTVRNEESPALSVAMVFIPKK